jgi:hypothetical protein
MAEAWANFAGGLSQLLEPVLDHQAEAQLNFSDAEKMEILR